MSRTTGVDDADLPDARLIPAGEFVASPHPELAGPTRGTADRLNLVPRSPVTWCVSHRTASRPPFRWACLSLSPMRHPSLRPTVIAAR